MKKPAVIEKSQAPLKGGKKMQKPLAHGEHLAPFRGQRAGAKRAGNNKWAAYPDAPCAY